MVLLEVVRMNLKVHASTRSNKKEFVGTKAGQIRIIPATFEEKILGARFERQLLKTNCFFGNLKQLIIQVPLQPGLLQVLRNLAQISAPHFNKCKIFLHSCKIN
jgi:hypothetical protein